MKKWHTVDVSQLKSGGKTASDNFSIYLYIYIYIERILVNGSLTSTIFTIRIPFCN
jgi:hypothetical protein